MKQTCDGTCHACGDLIVDRAPNARYCSVTCRDEVGRERARVRGRTVRYSTVIPRIKECCRCHEMKLGTEFYANFRFRDGLAGHCKRCQLIGRRISRYGVAASECDAMEKAQGGVCAVCGGVDDGRPLSVDHDHDSGYIRGLLCRTCNAVAGLACDDPERLRALASYLEKAKRTEGAQNEVAAVA